MLNVHIWMTILGNYSISVDHDHVCSNGKLSRIIGSSILFQNGLTTRSLFPSWTDGANLFPVVIQEQPLLNMKFVTCNQRGLHDLPFIQLLNVFDTSVWIMIIVIYVVIVRVIVAMREPPKSKPALRRNVCNLFLIGKALLEQGDLVPESISSDRIIQWIIGAYILTGVVLSNAYKNTNVYNMIIPRKAIFYEKFQELFNDNFTIYTRAMVSKLNPLHAKSETDIFDRRVDMHYVHEIQFSGYDPIYTYQVFSELKVLHTMLTRLLKGEIQHERNLTGTLLEKTSLAPFIVDFLNRALTYGGHLMFNGTSIRFRDIEQRMKEYFSALEQNKLFQMLRKCETIAILLPEYDCVVYAQQLPSDDQPRLISIGKESIGLKFAFSLKGLLPGYIIHRIRDTHAANIWSRWVYLVKETVKFKFSQINRVPLEKPTMKGNILVIFFMLFGGLVISGIVYLIEM